MSHFTVKIGNTFPLGATIVSAGIQFSMVCSGEAESGIVLISKKNANKKYRIPYPQGSRMGNIASMIVENISPEDFTYRFYDGEKEYIDPYSERILGNEIFGKKNPAQYELSSALDLSVFDWQNDSVLCTPFSKSILYLLHVRGFTKDASSKVKNPGTFTGIIEKIPYLQELGITAIELLPCYEFEEYR